MPPVVLMVCLGNICRSPTAEATLKDAAEAAGLQVEVRSGGTGAWHVGSPPDERMRRAAADVGVTLTGRAQQVDAQALREADVVFAMDRHNLADLRRIADAAGITTPIRLFREFDPDLAGLDLAGPDHAGPDPAGTDGPADVPDPYHGGPDGFVEVVAMCRRTSAEIVARFDEVLGR